MEKKVKYKIEGNGLGIKSNQSPICVKLSPDIDRIVRNLSNRSDFLREAIAEKLERDGLLD